MDSHGNRAAIAAGRIARLWAAVALIAVLAAAAHAQAQPETPKGTEQNLFPVRQTVFLANATEQYALNDIQTDLRNMFPRMKIYGVASQRAITLAGTQEDVSAAQKMIAELDRPTKTYRLTYTLTEIDNGSRGPDQKYVLIAASGKRTTLVQGSKLPIMTAVPDKPDSPAQMQYVDVGLKIQATPESSATGMRLVTSVQQSRVVGEKPFGSAQEPMIGQTTLDATTNLAEGKPQVLGSIELSGSKRLEVQLLAEQVK